MSFTSYGKNLLMNGDFDLWQRKITSASTSSLYLADRWKTQSQSSNVTFSQHAGPTSTNGSNNCLQALSSGSNTFIQIGQQIEFADFMLFCGKTVTLSFWAKAMANTTASKALIFRYRNVSSVIDTTVLFTSSNTDSSITLTTSWAFYTQTFVIPSNAVALSIEFANTSTLANGDGFSISQVQLEGGSAFTNFENIPWAETIHRCERFYETSYDIGILPGASSAAGGEYHVAINSADFYTFGMFKFKVKKRTTPSIATYNPSTGTATQFHGFSDSSNSAVINVRLISTTSASVSCSPAILTANFVYQWHWTADADF